MPDHWIDRLKAWLQHDRGRDMRVESFHGSQMFYVALWEGDTLCGTGLDETFPLAVTFALDSVEKNERA